jgi:poly(3-hydroxybutyrate) depolymerase
VRRALGLLLVALVALGGLAADALGRGRGRSNGASTLLAPLEQTGSTWPAGANGRYDWAWTAASNGATAMTIAIDSGTNASYPSQEGQWIGRDTTGAQQHTRVTITTAGGVIWSIATSLTTEATCTLPAGTFSTSQRRRLFLSFDGLAATNALRARAHIATVDAGGIVDALSEVTCTYAGTIPAALTVSTTAVWSVGARFGGAVTYGLRNVTVYEIAIWAGLTADPADALVELSRARDWTATSLGPPDFRWTFNGSTVTDTVRGVSPAVVGTAPSAASAQSPRNRAPVTASPGCGRAPYSTTATISQTWVMAVGEIPRSALVVSPGSDNGLVARPPMIIPHGCTFTPATMRADELAATSFGLEALGRSAAIYAYPAGLPTTDVATQCPVLNQTGWTLTRTSTNQDFAFMRRLTRVIDHRFCADTSRTIAVGRSLGSGLVNAMAAADPAVFRAIGSLVAVYPVGPANAPLGAVAGIQTGNNNDNIAQVGGVSLIYTARDRWITANGCSASAAESGVPDCLIYSCSGAPLTVCIANRPDHAPESIAPNDARAAIVRGLRRLGY